jgi:transcriptional regulator with XRE-family HTH domain
MAKISMAAHGRFGQLFIAAVNRKGVSLRDVAARFDYSYEQMRRLVMGTSWPSEELLRGLCKYLDMDYDETVTAANADRMEKRYGVEGTAAALGKNPRLSDIEPLLSQLDENEWRMFVAQIAGYIRERSRTNLKRAK